MPSWSQVNVSNSSSSVPVPPGRQTNPSARSIIISLRSCIDPTTWQLGQRLVRDLLLLQGPRDDADDVATGRQHGVRDHAHGADVRAAVHEAEAALGEHRSQPLGRSRVVGLLPGLEPRYTQIRRIREH